MQGLRFSGMLQPALVRTASAVSVRVKPAFDRTAEVSQEAAPIIGAILTPAAMLALVLGLWRLGTDLNWTDEFFIGEGLFSHWQVWIALAIGLKMLGSVLNRAETGKDD